MGSSGRDGGRALAARGFLPGDLVVLDWNIGPWMKLPAMKKGTMGIVVSPSPVSIMWSIGSVPRLLPGPASLAVVLFARTGVT